MDVHQAIPVGNCTPIRLPFLRIRPRSLKPDPLKGPTSLGDLPPERVLRRIAFCHLPTYIMKPHHVAVTLQHVGITGWLSMAVGPLF